MPVYKDASDVIKRKNSMTIYTNIKKQRDDLNKGLVNRVFYQGGGYSTGTFILTQMKKGAIYSSDIETKEVMRIKGEAEAEAEAEGEAEAFRVESERLKAGAAHNESERLKAVAEAVRLEALHIKTFSVEAEVERLEALHIKTFHAKAEVERLKAKAEAEVEAKAKSKAEAEAERLKSKAKAEAERLKSEAERLKSEAERLKSEAELLKSEAEAEAERLKSEAKAEAVPIPSDIIPFTKIKVLILGDITIGLMAIQIKKALQAKYTKVKTDVCILGTTYDGSRMCEYDKVYFYPTQAHPGAPSLQQNLEKYIKNGGEIIRLSN
jgi:hypothetical protein